MSRYDDPQNKNADYARVYCIEEPQQKFSKAIARCVMGFLFMGVSFALLTSFVVIGSAVLIVSALLFVINEMFVDRD